MKEQEINLAMCEKCETMKSIKEGRICARCKEQEQTSWQEKLLEGIILSEFEDYDEKRDATHWKINPEKLENFVSDLLHQQQVRVIEEIEKLAVEFPVRESDEFDEGRKSMKREAIEIVKKI